MVADSRTPARADQLRPLNRPRPVEVVAEADVPVALVDGGQTARVERVQERWQIEDEWWREPVRRAYFRVVTEGGRLRTLYHDRVSDGWFEQAY